MGEVDILSSSSWQEAHFLPIVLLFISQIFISISLLHTVAIIFVGVEKLLNITRIGLQIVRISYAVWIFLFVIWVFISHSLRKSTHNAKWCRRRGKVSLLHHSNIISIDHDYYLHHKRSSNLLKMSISVFHYCICGFQEELSTTEKALIAVSVIVSVVGISFTVLIIVYTV